jgi:hypothetical protein
VPYKWRFWWDFGTGETGNWGCHILDLPYWALGLRHTTRVAGFGPPVDKQRTPKSMTTRFEFLARGKRPPVTLHWYHASNGPPVLAKYNLKPDKSCVLFIGSEGLLLCGFKTHKLYPESKFADFKPPARTIPDSPGFHREWIDACGRAFAWDAKAMKAQDCPKAGPYLRPEFRKGWPL